MLLKKQHWAGLIVFLCMLGFTAFSVNSIYQLRKSKEIERLQREVNSSATRIDVYLSECQDILGTLQFIISQYGFPKDFKTIGENLMRAHPVVGAIEYVHDSTIIAVYPSKGNEVVLGYKLLEDSTRNKEAFKAIKDRAVYFAGPFKLKQGGIGIIGRMPIFNGNSYKGLTAAIIYLDTLFKYAGIKPSTNLNLEYMLGKKNPNDGRVEYFNAFENFNPEKDTYAVAFMPEGEWYLYARSKKSEVLSSLLPLSVAGVLFALVSALLVFYLVRQPEQLKKLVNNKINEIKRHELLISLTQESARIGSWSIDLESHQLNFTPMAREIYGIEDGVFKDIKDFVSIGYDKDDRLLLEQSLRDCMNKGQSFDVDLRINRSFLGLPYWVRVTGMIHVEEGKYSIYGATQDIDNYIKTSNERSQILSSIQDVFVACDDDWNVVYWNKAAEKLFNISNESIHEKKLLDFIHQHTQDSMFREFFQSDDHSGTFNFEFYSSVLSIWCEVSMYKMPTGFTAYIRDVTERHQYIEKIEAQNKVLRDIAWTQSHVVRAPLARLLGALDLLNYETDKVKSDRLKEIIHESAQELDDIVKDIVEKSDREL